MCIYFPVKVDMDAEGSKASGKLFSLIIIKSLEISDHRMALLINVFQRVEDASLHDDD